MRVGACGRSTQIETSMWLSMATTGLLVIETTITPDFNGDICFDDSLRGVNLDWNMGGLMAPRYAVRTDTDTTPDGSAAIELTARMGQNASAGCAPAPRCQSSLILIKTGADHSASVTSVTTDITSNLDHTKGPRAITRRTSFAVQAGCRYTVRKVAALTSDADADDLSAAAIAIVAAARSDLEAARQATKPPGLRAGNTASW